ncbi:PHP domain-containing protein [Clostridium vincentii]|uniref:DNA polymerase/3'-5' exonuclease PolX n=1 Tax=Clostridium vincentii TaxID=52704 RepID=A0A2T0BCU2_9CLOT|nr:PHP domain-containing protein [Clostridium vincentii]PRR81720.1 DNA polymerase/3'-5' exonuclease PolX [Clostridium vincentii]
MSYVDLHMHSIYSDDGEFQPKELVELCLKKNIRYFSIADHNSTKAISEAVEYCMDENIEIIPAVELDCTIDGVNLHVLGYGIDYENKIFNKIEEDIIQQEQGASKKRIDLIRQLGINFSDKVIQGLSKNGVVNGEMIAEAAMKFDTEHKDPLLKPYYENGSRSDNPYVNFYWDYCAQGKPAYAKVNFISLEEAVKIIEDTGGIAVLAHPGNNVHENGDLLESIISCGIKGIEVYSSYHKEEQVQYYKEFSLKNKLILTSGSDYHGKTKPSISIGSSECDNNEKEIISELKKSLNMKK